MKAVVVREFGGPEVLEYLDWPDPSMDPDEVLIDVHAVSIGRTLDVEVRRRGADFHVTLPRILGSDPAGVVAAVGSEVVGFAVGDRVVSISSVFCGECDMCRSGREHACVDHRVVGVHLDGGYAERCAMPAGAVVPVPDNVTFAQAAAMGVSYTTAWNLLVNAARLDAGEDVLIMGAGGGLGIAGVAIAQALGARPIAAAGAEWKLDRLRSEFGVERVADYSQAGWSDGIDADVVF
jgi:NADPH:quinone reductase-like Zn-dependent oxidoreductase